MILGITIEPGHDCTCSTEEEVHLSLASIESRSYCGGAGSYSQLMLKTASSEQLLCTFIHGVIFQQCLDLKLMPGEKVTFTVQGSYRIYITGYSNGSCGNPLLPGCEQEDTEGRNDDNIVVKPEADNTENFNGDGRDVEMSNDIEVLQEGQQDIVVKSEPDDGEDFNGESRDDEISNDNEVLQERQQGESCPQIKSEPKDYDDLNNGSWNEEMTEPNSRLSEGLNGRLEGEDYLVSQESVTSKERNGQEVEEVHTGGPDVLAEEGHGFHQTLLGEAIVTDSAVEGSIDNNPSVMPGRSIIETAALFAHGTSEQENVMNDMVEDNIDRNYDVPLLPEDDSSGVTGTDGGNLLNTENSSVESNSQEQSNVCSRSNTDISDTEPGEPLKVNEMNQTAPPHETEHNKSTSGLGHGNILEIQGKKKQVPATKNLKVCLCKYCVKSFNCKDDLELHEQSHSNEKTYSCKQCEEVFLNKESLVTHEKTHQIEDTFVYKECKEEFTSKLTFLEHKKVHRNKSPNYCNDCEKIFINQKALEAHKKVHKREKVLNNLMCKHCKKQFSKVKDLSLHMKVHTGPKNFKCSHCDKRFSRRRDLAAHELTHTGEKPFQCDQCEKSFNRNSTLQTHMKIHTGEKSFQCYHCGKSFRHKYTLVHHERIHTKVKPYNCKYCNKTFNAKSTLKLHEWVHSEDKPFPCNQCEKAFSSKNLLIRHETIHSGEKPYKCNMCEKTFNQRAGLISHEKIHTGDMPYKCKYCDKEFAWKSNYLSHERIHTRDESS